MFNPLLHARADVVRASIVTGEDLLRKVNFETGVLEEFHPAEKVRVPTGIVVRDGDGNTVEGIIHAVRSEDTMHLSLQTQPEMYRGTRVEFSFASHGIPPLGYAFHDFRLTYEKPAAPPKAGQIENELFQVTFRKADASLAVKDKRTGLTYEGLHVFEDGGDAGDEYTYSWPRNDAKVSLSAAGVSVATEGSAAYQTLVVRGVLRAPARLAPDGRAGHGSGST